MYVDISRAGGVVNTHKFYFFIFHPRVPTQRFSMLRPLTRNSWPYIAAWCWYVGQASGADSSSVSVGKVGKVAEPNALSCCCCCCCCFKLAWNACHFSTMAAYRSWWKFGMIKIASSVEANNLVVCKCKDASYCPKNNTREIARLDMVPIWILDRGRKIVNLNLFSFYCFRHDVRLRVIWHTQLGLG